MNGNAREMAKELEQVRSLAFKVGFKAWEAGMEEESGLMQDVLQILDRVQRGVDRKAKSEAEAEARWNELMADVKGVA